MNIIEWPIRESANIYYTFFNKVNLGLPVNLFFLNRELLRNTVMRT